MAKVKVDPVGPVAGVAILVTATSAVRCRQQNNGSRDTQSAFPPYVVRNLCMYIIAAE